MKSSSDLIQFRVSFHAQCQKLLFSATLTRDPAKIAALNLTDPQYFIIQDDRDQAAEGGVYAEESFSVPSTLKASCPSPILVESRMV